MGFVVKKGVVDCRTIKVSCTDADDNVCKEELPIYGDNVPKEIAIQLLEESLVMAERFEWFDGDDAGNKAKLIFQHFGRALKGMPQRKWAKVIRNHHTYTLPSFRSKAQLFFHEIFGEDVYEEQYQFLCDTGMPKNMKAGDYIDRVEVILDRLPLLDKEADKMSDREAVRKIIAPNIPNDWRKDFILKEGDKAKNFKQVKTILKTIEKARGVNKTDKEESSGKKKTPKEPAPTPPDKNKCRLVGHNHNWKNCPNNPNSKNYNGIHYSKIREQERAGAAAVRKNDDESTRSDEDSKKPSKKRRHHKDRREVNSIDSSSTSMGSPVVRFSEVRDSIESQYSMSSESRGYAF